MENNDVYVSKSDSREAAEKDREAKSGLFISVSAVLILIAVVQLAVFGFEIKGACTATTYSSQKLLTSIQYGKGLEDLSKRVALDKYSGMPITDDMANIEAYADYSDARMMYTLADRLNDKEGMDKYEKLMEEAKGRMGGLAVKAEYIDVKYSELDVVSLYEVVE